MQGGCNVVAEDSCFIKHHSKNENVNQIEPPVVDTASHDVEKAEVTDAQSPAAEESGATANNLQYEKEKGVVDENQDSGHSTDSTEDEKDDFPEGGFKA